LAARRGRIYLLIAGVAVFTQAALFFTMLVVLLLASSAVVLEIEFL